MAPPMTALDRFSGEREQLMARPVSLIRPEALASLTVP